MRNLNVGGAGLTEIGNVSALELAIEEEEKSLRDYRSPGGGTLNEVRRITGAGLSMTAANISPDNLAMAVYGETTEVAGATITDEEIAAIEGALIPLDHMVPTVVTVEGVTKAVTSITRTDAVATVTTTAAHGLVSGMSVVIAGAIQTEYNGTHVITVVDTDEFTYAVTGTPVSPATGTITFQTVYRVTTDYEVRTAGIYIVEDGLIVDADTLYVTYTYAAQDVVEAMISAAQEYELLFEGLNEARSGKASIVRVWRARFGAAKNVSLIGDDYASLELAGSALADTTKPTGSSQYFQATILQ
jgi:hypothetical protein